VGNLAGALERRSMSTDWLASLFNPATMFWLAITLMVVTPVVFDYWRKMKRDEQDAALKHEMIARGMSADEIERILKSRSSKSE
jgi:hypothetical protein